MMAHFIMRIIVEIKCQKQCVQIEMSFPCGFHLQILTALGLGF